MLKMMVIKVISLGSKVPCSTPCRFFFEEATMTPREIAPSPHLHLLFLFSSLLFFSLLFSSPFATEKTSVGNRPIKKVLQHGQIWLADFNASSLIGKSWQIRKIMPWLPIKTQKLFRGTTHQYNTQHKNKEPKLCAEKSSHLNYHVREEMSYTSLG